MPRYSRNRNVSDAFDLPSLPPQQAVEVIETSEEKIRRFIEAEEQEAAALIQQPNLNQDIYLMQRLVRMFITGRYTIKQLSTLIGVPISKITEWLGDSEVAQMIESYQKIEFDLTNAQMNALRNVAMERLKRIMETSTDDKAAVFAIREILDRTGHKVSEKQDININISYEQRLAQLKTQAIEATVIEEIPNG